MPAPTPPWRKPGFWIGLAAFAAIAFIPSGLHRTLGFGSRPAVAAATTALMAVWWFTEALPIAVTACVPLLVQPVFGLYGQGLAGDARRAAEPFVDGYIFLFLGGMMLGAAMEETGLHRRIALRIMQAIGAGPRRLLLGMLVATAAVSLWISNTATAVMMMPIARALLAQLEAGAGRKAESFGAALMLAVAYACNVGGIGTKIGTGTNSIFCGLAEERLGIGIGFLQYVAFALPFVILFIPVVWLVLWRSGRADAFQGVKAGDALDTEVSALGRMSGPERRVALTFAAAAGLWIAGDLVRPLIAPWVPRFWDGYAFQSKHYEAGVAMAAGAAVLLLRCLGLRGLLRIPFGTLLLLGGSFAMAAGIEGSGLSRWLSAQLAPIADVPLAGQVGLAASATVLLTAVASNTATVNVMLSVLPKVLPVWAVTAMASSCDFMLPAGTPPNAIVFGSGYVRLPVMMRTGALLDLLAMAALTAYGILYVPLILG